MSVRTLVTPGCLRAQGQGKPSGSRLSSSRRPAYSSTSYTVIQTPESTPSRLSCPPRRDAFQIVHAPKTRRSDGRSNFVDASTLRTPASPGGAEDRLQDTPTALDEARRRAESFVLHRKDGTIQREDGSGGDPRLSPAEASRVPPSALPNRNPCLDSAKAICVSATTG